MLRYRAIVDDPRAAVDQTCRFLGIRTGLVDTIPKDNARSFVTPGWRPRVLGRLVRTGATLGQFAPPHVWRKLSAPLVSRLSGRGEVHRPRLTAEARERLIPAFADDIALLSQLTGEDFGDWLATESRGSYQERAEGLQAVSEPA